jgi:hypothetical protein
LNRIELTDAQIKRAIDKTIDKLNY